MPAHAARIAFVLAVVLTVPARAETPIASGEQFGLRSAVYYLMPNPFDAVRWLGTIEAKRLDDPRLARNVAAFLTVILNHSPESAIMLMREAQRYVDPARRAVAIRALSQSDIANKGILLERLGVEVGKQRKNVPPPVDFEAMPIVTLDDLDLRWTLFFATGRQAHVFRIADLLGDAPEPQRRALAKAAAHSLAEVAARHPVVADALLRYAQGRSDAAARQAQEIASSR